MGTRSRTARIVDNNAVILAPDTVIKPPASTSSSTTSIDYDSDETVQYDSDTGLVVPPTGPRSCPDCESVVCTRTITMTRCYRCITDQYGDDDGVPDCCLSVRYKYNQEHARCRSCIEKLAPCIDSRPAPAAECRDCESVRKSMPYSGPLMTFVCCLKHREYMTPDIYYELCPLCAWQMDRARTPGSPAPVFKNRLVCSYHRCRESSPAIERLPYAGYMLSRPVTLPFSIGRPAMLVDGSGQPELVRDYIEEQQSRTPESMATALFEDGYIDLCMYSEEETLDRSAAAIHLLTSDAYRERVRATVANSISMRQALAWYVERAPLGETVRELYVAYMPELCVLIA